MNNMGFRNGKISTIPKMPSNIRPLEVSRRKAAVRVVAVKVGPEREGLIVVAVEVEVEVETF